MKRRKILHILSFLFTFLFLSGCMTGGEWSYIMQNGYRITTTPSGSLLHSDNYSRYTSNYKETIVPNYDIYKFTTNGRYSGVILVDSEDWDEPYIYTDNETKKLWCIIDEDKLIIYGPFSSEEEYVSKAHELGIKHLGLLKRLGTTNRIDRHIIEFCYNNLFLGIKWISKLDRDEEVDTYAWFIVDCTLDTIFGPYNDILEYEAALFDLGVTGLSEWISTDKMPKGATAFLYKGKIN